MKTAAALFAVLALLLAVAGCGGDDEADEQPPPPAATETDDGAASGEAVFTENCGSCHTLSDAGTTGTVGPNLDGIDRSQDEIEQQVRNGGGGMPAFEGQLSDDEIEAVSEYVAGAAGG